MNTLVPIDIGQASQQLSKRMRERMQAGKGLNQNFADGVRDAFPLLSIKGKVFRVRVDGDEKALIDPATKQPIPFLDVVLVNAAPMLSKTYYAKGFTDGDMNPPDCWSLDSIKPDASVANKMAPLCGNCPMNAFGSKITDNGKAAKACQDARRVAVVMPHQLAQNNQMLLLLRVPQSSLKNLKAYANLLARHLIEPGACITRLAFDYQEAFPKLLFNFVAPLSDDQFDVVVELAEADNTKLMLQAPDFETSQSAQPLPNASGSMQGMPVQSAPVMEDVKPDLPQGMPINGPSHQTTAVASSIITLPDGKLFNTVTGQYVEKVEAKKEPELDPMTIKLPDGKFYNQKRSVFVTGPEMGAPEVSMKAEAPKKKTPPKKAEAAKPATEQTMQQMAQPQPNGEAEEEADEPEPVSQQSNAGVKPASKNLEDFLAVLMPPSG